MPIEDLQVSEGEPHDRQTQMADLCLMIIQSLPDYDGEKLIVFLDGETTSAIGIAGYEDHNEPIANLFMHLRAMFAANGQELSLFPIKGGIGQG